MIPQSNVEVLSSSIVLVLNTEVYNAMNINVFLLEITLVLGYFVIDP